MNFEEVLLTRRSIRKFTDKSVDDGIIEKLMQYAMNAPSACNKMPWEFYIVKNSQKREELKKLTPYTNYQSPLIIVVAGNTKRSLTGQLTEFWVQDCSAAIENLLLGAHYLGLGACWCGIKPQKRAIAKAQSILEIEERIEPLALIHIGYPTEVAEPHDRYNAKRVHIIE